MKIPREVWLGVTALFLVLCGVKLLLLAHVSKQLFEVHWRTNASEVKPLDYLNCGVFVLLGSLSLARLAHDTGKHGVKAARLTNLAVLTLGIPFLFLTFHQGANNYLYPILSGVLKWRSLVPYLADDLFFNPPFLSLWTLAYALGYYLLTRTKHEQSCIYLTAAFAALYAPNFLSRFAICQNELLALNTIGAISLMTSAIGGRVKTTWFAMPWIWTIAGAAMILIYAPHDLGPSLGYFVGVIVAVALLLAAAAMMIKKAGQTNGWRRFAFFYAAVFLLLADTGFPAALNFNQALGSGLTFPRYFLGETVLSLGLLLGFAFASRFLPRAAVIGLYLLAIGMIAITIVDYRVLQIMGVRFEWSVLELGNSPKMMWRMAKPYLPALVLLIAAIAGAYFGMVYVMTKGFRNAESGRNSESRIPKLEFEREKSGFGAGWGYAGALFLGLGLLGLVIANSDKAEGQAVVRLAASSPLWNGIGGGRMSLEEFQRNARELKFAPMENTPINPSKPRRDLNVVLVFMESTYNKHLSLFGSDEDTQPLLSKYRDQMELYPNFFSTFASSIHARFASFCSLYPTRDFNAFTMKRVGVKSIFEVLHQNGFETSLFYSSFLDFTGFRDFLANRGIDHLYDADTMPGERHSERVAWGLREEETLGAMRQQIKDYASSGKRFFMTYVPAAPHYPYDKVPEQFHRYKPVQIEDYTPMYLNELLYMDWILASLIDQLRDSGVLNNTLVIITDDHGEMLGGKGKPIGHGWLLTPDLVNAPLIIMDPDRRGARINRTVGCQVDLLPTILDRLGIETKGISMYQGRSLDQSAENRVMYLNSYQQYATLEGNRLCFGDRERRGAAECYSIENDGAKTRFVATPKANAMCDIAKFDRFQENLLKNYSYYADKRSQVNLTKAR